MKIIKFVNMILISILLSNCASNSGNNRSLSGSHGPRPNNPNQGGGSTGGGSTGGGSTGGSSTGGTGIYMDKFIDTNKLLTQLSNENNNRINSAFKTAGITINTTNTNIAKTALEKGDIQGQLDKLTPAISYYKDTFTPKKEQLTKTQKYQYGLGKFELRKPSESDADYAKRLNTLMIENNTGIIKTDAMTDEEYIKKVLTQWGTYINNANIGISTPVDTSSLSSIESSFQTIYEELNQKASSATSEYNQVAQELLTKIKTIDSDITELPLSLDKLMEHYALQEQILKAIKDISYIKPPSKGENGFKYITKSYKDSSDSDEQIAKFNYDTTKDDYILTLKDIEEGGNHTKDRTISFKSSDFESFKTYYQASKISQVGESEIAYTYLPNLKKYIYAGGQFDVNLRKQIAKDLISKITKTTATADEVSTFNTWFGQSLSYPLTASDVQKVKADIDLALKILNKNESNFDITKIKNLTDIVKLGGKSLNLSYVDFGLWTIKGNNAFSGDSDLISNKKDSELDEETWYIDNPFFAGLDEFAVAFTKDSGADVNAKTKFTGKTFGVASTSSKRKELSGSVVLEVNNQTAKGNITLDFTDWYNFKFSDIDFSSKGFTSTNNPEITNSLENDDIKIQDDISSSKIDGSLYGPEANNPTEFGGIYEIESGDGVKVEGSFAGKK